MRLAPALVLPLFIWPALARAQGVTDPNQTIAIANLAAPAVGQTAVDPSFGITVRRLTDRGSNGGLATAEYPQLQAVNSDETRILVSTDQGYSILDVATLSYTHELPEISMPRWNPADPDMIIGYNQRSGGSIVLQRYELMPNGMVVVSSMVDVSALGFDSLELASWEDMSDDGRYVGLYGDLNGNTTAAVLDVMAGTIRSSVTINTDVDWVSVSPSGNYFAVQYLPRGIGNVDGLVIYDAANGTRLGHAVDHHEHGDLGRDTSGNDMFTTIAYTDYCANGAVPCCSMSPLPDALESNRINNLYELAAGIYSSCRNHQRPGFCVHSDDSGNAGQTAFAMEIWLTRLSDGGVLRLFHHRSSACSYYNSTRPTVSPTGRYVLFTSDWASPNCSDEGDSYLIDTQPFLTGFLGAVPPPTDAGVPDSGAVDSGAPDTGVRVDTGVPISDAGFDDAGAPLDVGPPDDSGVSPDAGPIPDAGSNLDATASDTGSPDSGAADRDRDIDGGLSGGCGCSTSPVASRSPSLAGLMLLGWALFRRRVSA